MPFSQTSLALLNPVTGPNRPGQHASLSGDGRMAAFVVTDQNFVATLYVQNLTETNSVRALPLPSGVINPTNPVLSANGDVIAFLAQAGQGGLYQVYSHDMRTGVTNLVSKSTGGLPGGDAPGNGDSGLFGTGLSISDDGRYIVFGSSASNLVSGDTNGFNDVFVRDLRGGVTRLVSGAPDGSVTNSGSSNGVISHDGRFVAFASSASNLLGTPANEQHLFLKNLDSGALSLVDVGSNGRPIGLSPLYPNAVFSADDSKLVFHNFDLAYLKDFRTGAISVASTGPNAAGQLIEYVSNDGNSIIYLENQEIFQKDLQTGIAQSITPHAALPNNRGLDSGIASISDDGQTILLLRTQETFFGTDLAHSQRADSSNQTLLYLAQTLNPLPAEINQGYVGSSGADQLAGTGGNDSYWINHAGDVIVELVNEGTDRAYSLLTDFTLPEHVEILQIAGTGAANGSGNGLDNFIFGNSQINVLRGLGGDDVIWGGSFSQGANGLLNASGDTLDGGSGFDIARYDASFGLVAITRVGNETRVGISNSFTVPDSLQNIERIEFSDRGFSLPGDAHGGQAYRIYQAAFNRTPDAGGLGFWIKQLDLGANLVDVAGGFIQSDEFKSLYGNNPTNSDFVLRLYQNVLHRAPDAGGFAFWNEVLDSGRGSREVVLAQFSESPENQAALAGVIGSGFSYTLFTG